MKMTDVLEIANKSHCRNKVIILNCCFAARKGESLLVNNNSVLGEGVTIMAASQTWQTSEKNKNKENGISTELLLQGLKGGSNDVNGEPHTGIHDLTVLSY